MLVRRGFCHRNCSLVPPEPLSGSSVVAENSCLPGRLPQPSLECLRLIPALYFGACVGQERRRTNLLNMIYLSATKPGATTFQLRVATILFLAAICAVFIGCNNSGADSKQ